MSCARACVVAVSFDGKLFAPALSKRGVVVVGEGGKFERTGAFKPSVVVSQVYASFGMASSPLVVFVALRAHPPLCGAGAAAQGDGAERAVTWRSGPGK